VGFGLISSVAPTPINCTPAHPRQVRMHDSYDAGTLSMAAARAQDAGEAVRAATHAFRDAVLAHRSLYGEVPSSEELAALWDRMPPAGAPQASPAGDDGAETTAPVDKAAGAAAAVGRSSRKHGLTMDGMLAGAKVT
jgi:hypothetical protein